MVTLNRRENLLSLYRRQGASAAALEFNLCPSLVEEFHRRYGADADYTEVFGFSRAGYWFPPTQHAAKDSFRKYFPEPLKDGSHIDDLGVAHEPGSEAAKHMTRMRHPLAGVTTIAELEAYPWPDFTGVDQIALRAWADRAKAQDRAPLGEMACTVWETSWYLRSMELLMEDMSTGDEKATWLLNKVTELSCERARIFARAGFDIIEFGDDVGMQSSIMMSAKMYRTWLKPRLRRVVDAAKEVKPDILIQYHTCGFVTPLIPDLIEAGVEILNPVQPECMDFRDIHAKFGDRLSFNGTIGTQTTMPFGTPDEVRAMTLRNLDLAGAKGGLVACPTHLVEPEVPWENIEAYAQACRDWRP